MGRPRGTGESKSGRLSGWLVRRLTGWTRGWATGNGKMATNNEGAGCEQTVKGRRNFLTHGLATIQPASQLACQPPRPPSDPPSNQPYSQRDILANSSRARKSKRIKTALSKLTTGQRQPPMLPPESSSCLRRLAYSLDGGALSVGLLAGLRGNVAELRGSFHFLAGGGGGWREDGGNGAGVTGAPSLCLRGAPPPR